MMQELNFSSQIDAILDSYGQDLDDCFDGLFDEEEFLGLDEVLDQ